jgi:hypothetical protein
MGRLGKPSVRDSRLGRPTRPADDTFMHRPVWFVMPFCFLVGVLCGLALRAALPVMLPQWSGTPDLWPWMLAVVLSGIAAAPAGLLLVGRRRSIARLAFLAPLVAVYLLFAVGTVANLEFVMALAPVAAVWFVSITTWGFNRMGRSGPRGVGCDHCGYDLTANVSGTCPECGADAMLSRVMWSRRPRVRLIWSCLVILLVTPPTAYASVRMADEALPFRGVRLPIDRDMCFAAPMPADAYAIPDPAAGSTSAADP